MQGGYATACGVWSAEVARQGDVSRQLVLRWTKLHERGGKAALQGPGRFGGPLKLDSAQRAQLIKALKTGLERAVAHRACTPPRRGGEPYAEAKYVARHNSIATRHGRITAFIEESGLSERPRRARLGPTGPDTSCAVQVLQEAAVGDCWSELPALQLSILVVLEGSIGNSGNAGAAKRRELDQRRCHLMVSWYFDAERIGAVR